MITEINLDFSEKAYLRPLSLLEILEIWCRPPDTPLDSSDPDDEENDAGNMGGGENGAKTEGQSSAQFDVLNFYDMYRSFYTLRRRLKDAIRDRDLQLLMAYLVTRPDSVYRVAKQAGEDPKEHPIPRYLVLLEAHQIVSQYHRHLPDFDPKFTRDIGQWQESLHLQVRSIPSSTYVDLPVKKVLLWFEKELKRAWHT